MKIVCRAVVRFCSSLLTKVVDSLAPSITAILVRGKQVGRLSSVLSDARCVGQFASVIHSEYSNVDWQPCPSTFNPLKGRGVSWLHFAIQV